MIEHFGEGIKSYGTGPSSYERVGLDVRGQKKRAREYGEEIANDIENSEEFGSKDKTASVRVERYRSTRSKTFLNSLKKAKDNKHAFVLLNVNQVSATMQKYRIKVFNQIIEVRLTEKPSCTCTYFNRNNRKQSETCCHVIWILLYYYQMIEEDPILQQIAITSQEITTIFSLVPNVSILRPDAFDPKNNEANSTPDFDSTNIGINSAKLTVAEEQAIVESRGDNSGHHIWKLNKLQDRKNAKYATCKATMPPGKIFVEVNALYIPPNQSFAVNRTFYSLRKSLQAAL